MALESDIPETLRKFIEVHIHSVASLEVLLLIFTHSNTGYSAVQLSNEMRSNPSYAEALLSELSAEKLLKSERHDSDVMFSLSDLPAETLAQIALLQNLYSSHRLSIINIIYESPVKKLKVFADAFKLRK